MHLIPAVKELTTLDGYLKNTSVCPRYSGDSRLEKALAQLPLDPQGTPLTLQVGSGTEEGYRLRIGEEEIAVSAPGPAGAFYAIQTLRQILAQGPVPCLEIRDCPDFPIRGFYHDETRGRINTVARVKALIDDMARFKLNSLQLYVEHVFEFRETAAITPHSGCYTKDELQELDEYCRERFIDFVPSLSTFGHMNDILNQPQYRHLRVLNDYTPAPNRWNDRMRHHTIDPRNPESIQLVQSLMDQFAPCFTSDWFNICCDETFDLLTATEDPGKLYVGFVKQILSHIKSLGKKAMMWADILLQYPETIGDLPQDTMFLNWYYRTDPVKMEEKIAALAHLGCNQIVCPGNTVWNRFCECYSAEVVNILGMIRLGHKYGAKGVLNTSWGDWGHTCNPELGMFGLVLGAAASWNVETENDEALHSAVNTLLYGSPRGMETLQRVSAIHDKVLWTGFVRSVFGEETPWVEAGDLPEILEEYRAVRSLLEGECWEADAYREGFLLALDAICVMAQRGTPAESRLVEVESFLARYREVWLRDNKPSELSKIEDLFRWEATGIPPRWEI